MLALPEITARFELSPPKVLIIDDEIGPRESVSFLLQNEFEVQTADRVDRGLDLLSKDTFAVVIMDIHMPHKNGIEGLEELRKIDPDVAVIMLTGHGALRTAQVAISLGANEYINKPFQVEAMRQAVRRHSKEALERKKRTAVLTEMENLYQSLKWEQKKGQAQIGYGQAAAEMVHDLCNPLVAAIGYAQLLLLEAKRVRLRAPAEFDKIVKYAETLEKCSSFCLHLADSWRQSSRSLIFERTDLLEICAEVKRILFFDLERIEIRGRPEIYIRASRYEIIRVLQNLVKNALESGATQVVLTLEQTDEKARLCISDNGKGMHPEMAAIILEKPVPTTKEHGTGLGITICRHLIMAHHGEIKLSSKLDEGTAFILEFPIFKPENDYKDTA